MLKPIRRAALAAVSAVAFTGVLAGGQISLSGPGIGQSADAQTAPRQLTASDAWSRASAPNARTGAVFLTINGGSADDVLESVETPIAERVELHTHVNDNGVMRMRQVENIPIPANKTTVLQPGGLHVMLFGLKEPLTEGSSFMVVLNFRNKYPIDMMATVRSAAATGSGGATGGSAGHNHGDDHQHGEDGHKHDHANGHTPAPSKAPSKAEHKHGQ